MNKNTRIFIATSLVLTGIIVVGVIYQNSQKELVKPKKKNISEKDVDDSDEKVLINSSQTELPLLQERIYIVENRNKFRDKNVEGYQDFIDRTKKAIDETHDKKLIFHNGETEYILFTYVDNKEEVKAVIKK